VTVNLLILSFNHIGITSRENEGAGVDQPPG
jgi:hypothetical protein